LDMKETEDIERLSNLRMACNEHDLFLPGISPIAID
jgi:hypothetical protein